MGQAKQEIFNRAHLISYFLLFIIFSNTSCVENSSKSSTPQNDEIVAPVPREDIKVIETGSVPIEDTIEAENVQMDEEEDYSPDYNLVPNAQQRLAELVQDPEYSKNNGRPNRAKIARILNSEGFRKSDGSKFKRRDIPKS